MQAPEEQVYIHVLHCTSAACARVTGALLAWR